MRAPTDRKVELTLRGVCLGAVITVIFMSANIYIGLKTGVTFSSSIPAAVISLGVLKLVGGGGILENNIVQTQASAAGTLCNVNLVIPGLVLIHYWDGFPFWPTTGICLLGGLLGVALSVPLRRVMVVDSDLPFPEGVAAAEVLKSGHQGERDDDGLRTLGLSALVAGGVTLLTTGYRLLSDRIGTTLLLGHSAFKFEISLSLALIGVGYLVRLGCCLALLLGILIAWGVAVPVLTALSPAGNPVALAETIWASKVRLIGAGLIAVAALWTVASLVRPIIDVIRSGLRAPKKSGTSETSSRDIPITWVGIGLLVLALPLAGLFAIFLGATNLPIIASIVALVAITIVLAALMAAACGYLAGLLGSSSSPISGISILTAVLVAVGCLATLPAATAGDLRFTIALSLFVTAVVITASSIANDNLQDLKAGHIVGATPWKQQAALAIGVVFGALTVAPVLHFLYDAYGFAGALPRSGMDAELAMPAPQAALLTQVVDGIVNRRLDWTMLAIGAVLGVLCIALEQALRRKHFSLPALSVGIGMYLPLAVVLAISVGGLIGWMAERAAPSSDQTQATLRRRGVLLSSGFLVGESAVGILLALIDVSRGKTGTLAFGGIGSPETRGALSAVVLAVLLAAFYRLTSRTGGLSRG